MANVPKKRRLVVNEYDDIESLYLSKKRSKWNNSVINKEVKLALPIKTKDGQLILKTYIRDDQEKNKNEEIQNGNNVKDEQNVAEIVVQNPLDLIKEKKEFIEKLKEKIAYLSRKIIENPQENMKMVKELRTLLSQPEVQRSNLLVKLVTVSLCEVFKDICPSYKIRAWTSKENQQMASKEVRKIKEYEETLLKQYKLYIVYLHELIQSSTRRNENNVTFIALRCVCHLFEKLAHFNFANELIDIIISQMVSRFSQISEMASQSIKDAFKNKTLYLSLEITQKIAKLCRQKSFGVKPEVLNVFLSLKLTEINLLKDENKSKKMLHKEKMKRLSRSERKKLKEKEKLENDLEEKKIKDQLKEKSNLQTRILEQVFAIYIRILKKTPNLKLIPCVLEGLAKFAHLINLDLFGDLLKLMHEMIESEILTFRSKLYCIKTVFVVLSDQGEALTIDPIKFYTSFYNVLLKFSAVHNVDDMHLLADCIEMMLIKRRKHVPAKRLLAFIKRLSILSIQLDHDGAVIILDLLKKLVQLDKSCDLLFDSEYQGTGIYNPELVEPDYASAQNSTLWELHILRRHYYNTVKENALSFLKESSSLIT